MFDWYRLQFDTILKGNVNNPNYSNTRPNELGHSIEPFSATEHCRVE